MAAHFGSVPGSCTPPPPQTPPPYVMMQVLGNGGVQFTAQESEYYSQLLTHVDPAGTGYIDGAGGAGFLGASGLPRETLQHIWGIADVNGQGYLSVEGFFVACRLVAWAQAGVPPSPDKVQSDPPMLPDFPDLPRRRSPSEASHGSRPPSVGAHSEQSELQPVIAGREEHVRRASEAVRYATSRSASPVRTFTQDRWAPSQRERRKYASLFQRTDWDGDGFVQGSEASALLERSHVDQGVLAMAWELSDQDRDGKLNFKEFVCLVHLVTCIRRGAMLQPGAALPVPLSHALQNLEPLEVLAAERERSRSRSASPHPSVVGTPLQTGRHEQDAGWMGEDPFAAKSSSFTEPAQSFETFPSDPFAAQKEKGGETLDDWAADGFGAQSKSKKEKKEKKKKVSGDKVAEGNDNWASSFPADLPPEPHGHSFAEDPFVTQQERPAALFDSTPKSPKGLAGFEQASLFDSTQKSPKGLAGHEHDQRLSEAIRHIQSVVGIDKDISSRLRDEVSRLDRELRRIEELDVQLERQVAQETQESERLQKEKQHLDRELAEAKHALSTLREDRKSAHLEGLSLRRDRVHLADELAFLRKMAEDEEETLSVLKGTNQYLEHSHRDLEANAQLLDQQQNELAEQLAREREQSRGYQRQVSELQHTLERLGQDRIAASHRNMASNITAPRVPPDVRISQVHSGDHDLASPLHVALTHSTQHGLASPLHAASIHNTQKYGLPSTANSMHRVPGSFISQREGV
eukprot:TRINITY_DN43357_c0_g1_i1.p1 TRINITY_DN43357_c0_g1~~TRINITY_DN43357_c0_g1_i1.p1  ORF type:complete len:747 (+),score=142.11 TRINITY_DN43357_c0_g1_i1:52-2292(+)